MELMLNLRSRFHNTRAQVYLMWAAIVGVGYIATYFYQNRLINLVWFVLATTGFVYMYRVMPIRLSLMKKIYLAWLVPVTFGLIVSISVFYVDSIAQLLGYLGAFWLIVQAVGFAWNGAVDPPSKWYYIAAAVNAIAGAACYFIDSLFLVQYLVAAAVSVWSMLMLWLFRAD